MRIAYALAALLLSCVACLGQSPSPTSTWDSPEFGEISELQSLTTVYVWCEDLRIRQQIVDELRKEPRLKVVSRVDDAQILINYTYYATTWYSDRGIFGTSTKTNRHDGDLVVSIAGTVDDQNRLHQRIVWSIAKDRKKSLGKDPYMKGIRTFLEDYRVIMLARDRPRKTSSEEL